MPNLPKVSVNKLSQQGAIHYLIPILLILGIIGGVYLITAGPLKLKPKASVSGPVGPSTALTLSPNLNNVGVGNTVGVKVLVRSDVAAVNLFTAKIKYPKDLLSVDKIDYSGSIVKNWVEQFSDNATGDISLVGGVPNPGFVTNSGGTPSVMAVIYFRAIKAGSAAISFTDESAVYDNANNLNILGQKIGTTITIVTGNATPTPTASPISDTGITISPASIKATATFGGATIKVGTLTNPTSGVIDFELRLPQFFKFGVPVNSFSPSGGNLLPGVSRDVVVQPLQSVSGTPNFAGLEGTYKGTGTLKNKNTGKIMEIPVELTLLLPTATPSATPIPGTGDGNNNGKSDLGDMSVLLTDFNKVTGFRKAIDMNGDGKINTFDFSLMRNLLIQKGVIRG